MPNLDDLDRELAAIAAGDVDAFARWVAAAEPILRRSLRSFAAAVDGEAVVQETLLRVWQVAPRCVPDGKANGLLRLGLSAARNLAISELRRVRVAQTAIAEMEMQSDRDVAAWAAPDPLLRQAIAECRRKLPAQPGKALAARIDGEGGVPDGVLAERLGMKLNTFLQNITRARKLLAECLRRVGVEIVAARGGAGPGEVAT
jgi:RNA polymerase sigma-70 factor (ECF subfamily)